MTLKFPPELDHTDTVGKIVVVLVFILPISMATIPGAASTINILLLILGIFFGWTAWRATTREEKTLVIAMLLFFSAAFLSFLNSDDISKSWSRLERLLRALAFIPVFLLMRRLTIDLIKPLCFGMIAAGPILLVTSLLNLDGGRAVGAYNAILFGDYSAIVTVFLLSYLLFAAAPRNWKVFALLSLICATHALVLSATRGAWAAPFFVGPILVILFTYKAVISRKFSIALIVAALPALLGIFAIGQSQVVTDRLNSAIEEFHGYASGTNPHTSLGFRFQMWEAGVKMWQKNPIIGSGLGDYSIDLGQMMKTGESQITEHFGEAHSLFFEFLGTTGTLGVVTLIFALFAYPMWMLRPKHKQDPSEEFMKVAGIALIMSFAIFGLTQNWLGRSSITSVYMVFLAIFLSSKNSSKLPKN